MNQYDELINQADMAVDDTIVEPKMLRLALEYVFFEQSKFYVKTSMVCL
jgi:hypothetical protein